MKGVPGLLIAVGLGIAGAFCNWLYLVQKGQELERVYFICVDEGTKINPGDKLVEAHFRAQPIPRNLVGDLDKTAFKWAELQTVVGMTATRSFTPGEIVLRQYLKTPPETDIKKLLAPDERAIWLPVDTRSFVSALVNPGDQVSFIVPRLGGGGVAALMEPGSVAALSEPGSVAALSEPGAVTDLPPPRAAATSATEIIGPYRILALGNRLGSREVLSSSGTSASQENVMAIAVKIVDNNLDARGQQISDLLRQTNFQQVQVLLHPPGDAKPKK